MVRVIDIGVLAPGVSDYAFGSQGGVNANFTHAAMGHSVANIYNVMAYALGVPINDGLTHPLSGLYATLAEAQAVFPAAIALTDELARVCIDKAIAACPAYALGMGGGFVGLPDGTYLVERAPTVKSGIVFAGAGKKASCIRGAVAGPLLTSPDSNTGTNQSQFWVVTDIYLNNTSTDAAARAYQFYEAGNIRLENMSAQSAGGYGGEFVCCTTVTLDGVQHGGAGMANTQAALYLNGTTSRGECNVVRLLNCDFQDSKSGVHAIKGTSLQVDGCHFEQLAGGSTTYDAGIAIDGYNGIDIGVNYWDSCVAASIRFYNAERAPTGATIGSGHHYNTAATSFVDVSVLNYFVVQPQHFTPGALNANPVGVVMSGASGGFGVVFPQHMTSGSGAGFSNGNAAQAVFDFAGGQGVKFVGAATNSNAFQAGVKGDSVMRFHADATGAFDWGSGSATRDTNLYRSAANQLKTDDMLLAALGLGVGNSAAATTLGSVVKKMEVFDASGNSLGYVPLYDAIT